MSIIGVTKIAVVTAIGFVPASPVVASDLLGGIVGGIIGGAIVQGSKPRRTYSSGVSSAVRAERKEIQTSLNYFGFPAGVPDGVMGRKSKAAVSNFQVFLGYPMTGQLTAFEKDFLLTSHRRALAGGYATQQMVATNPQGTRGLLVTYRTQMAGGQQAPVQAFGAAPTASPSVAHIVPAAAPTAVTSAASSAVSAADLKKMQSSYDELADQVSLLRAILEFYATQERTEVVVTKEKILRARMEKFKAQQVKISQTSEKKYQTPIHPTNGNLGITALKASEIYQRVPYYVPGTPETGEMWVAPVVTDEGELLYSFAFMDPDADFASERDKIMMQPDEIGLTARGFDKVQLWTKTAQDKKLRRRFEKRTECFPAANCEEKRTGFSSTEILFMLYEDGSTAAKVQRNKGTFSSGYNLSVESALVLSAYLDFMKEVGEKEFNLGAMTDQELDSLFQE